MMTSAPTNVDFDHLKRTLTELGYGESLTKESAPLVHHILADLNQASQQYNDLLQNYDDLFVKWQEAQSGGGGGGHSLPQNFQHKFTSSLLDLTHMTGLDSSILGFANTNNGQPMDESFILRTVEEARGKIDSLTVAVEELQLENELLKKEKSQASSELTKFQVSTQELSQLLQAKHVHQATLQDEINTLKKANETGILSQLGALAKTAIGMLPTEIQPAYSAKLHLDSIDSLANLLSELLLRLSKEMDAKVAALKETQETTERLRKEHDATEESMTKIKGLVAMYQGQIADLTSRLHQKDFEKSLQSDIGTQIAALERVNNMVKEKIATIERLRLENANATGNFASHGNTNGEMAQVTVNVLLENLSAELNTEACFTSHLNQVIDKLNRRRIEQDEELKKFNDHQRELENRIAEAEMEKGTIKGRMERLMNEVSTKESLALTNNEVIKSLQQALESKQVKIDEQKRYCKELKNALEQCQSSMTNMRRNEEMIRQHVLVQDEEIKKIRNAMIQTDSERIKTSQKNATLESELALTKAAFKEKTDEFQKISHEIKFATNACEKAQMELKTAKDQVRELEEMLTGKRKEKDLLMTTYCRVIKDNEKLHADTQKLYDDLMISKTGGGNVESVLKAHQVKLQAKTQELGQCREQLAKSQSQIEDLQSRLDDTVTTKRRLEDELLEKNKEINSLGKVISSLEQSKKDIAGQMSRFGQQASDLRNHLRRIDEERRELQQRLQNSNSTSSTDSPVTKNQLSKISNELGDLKERLREVERQRDVAKHQLEMEKTRVTEREKLFTTQQQQQHPEDERRQTTTYHSNKAADSIFKNVQEKMKKDKSTTILNNREQEKGLKSARRHLMSLNNGKGFKSSTYFVDHHNHYDYDDHGHGNDNTSHDDKVTPSPPASPTDEKGGGLKFGSTERLKNENELIRKQLRDAYDEMKQSLSPGGGRRLELSPDLESSIIALTSSEDADQSSSPTSDEIISTNAEIKRRLEHENRLLFKIVEKVKLELRKAGLETPKSIAI